MYGCNYYVYVIRVWYRALVMYPYYLSQPVVLLARMRLQ